MEKTLLAFLLSKIGFVKQQDPVAVTADLTVDVSHNGARFVLSGTTARTITIPAGLPANFHFSVTQLGTGACTVAAGAGVTLTKVSNFVKTAGAGARISINPVGANAYTLNGEGSV